MLQRSFSTREKVLLCILAVLLLGCFYWLVVLQPSLSATQTAESQATAAQDEILVQQVLSARKAQMEQELAQLEASGSAAKTIPAYDNTKNEVAELDSILSTASSYDIRFEEAEMSDSLVRRPVQISFRCSSYPAAHDVLTKLIDCRYSCLVTDIALTGDNLGLSSSEGDVSGNVTVTFFERME